MWELYYQMLFTRGYEEADPVKMNEAKLQRILKAETETVIK